MGCLQDAYATYIKLAKLWGNYSHTDGQRLTNGQWFKECRRFTQRDIQPYGKCGLIAVAGTVAGTVVGGLILAGILRLNGLFAKVVSGIWSGVSWLWGMLQSSHSMPGWVILVLGLLALFGLTIIGLWLEELLHGKKETAGPTFQKYTEDMLDAVRWRWRWVGNQITNLWCFCPICDAQLVPEGNFTRTRFICERCPADGTGFPHGSRGRVVTEVMGGVLYAVAAAEREILRRIRTGQR